MDAFYKSLSIISIINLDAFFDSAVVFEDMSLLKSPEVDYELFTLSLSLSSSKLSSPYVVFSFSKVCTA